MVEARIPTVLITAAILSSAGCGAEMVRPRSAGETFDQRPGRALVVGQFEVKVAGVKEQEIGLTRHRVVVGTDDALFLDEIPQDRQSFSVWVYPGVFCFGQPTDGDGTPPKLLGKGAPCAEIPEAGKAYYVGTVVWSVTKKDGKLDAKLEVNDQRESVAGSRSLVGIYPETVLVSTSVDADKAAAKYKLP